MCQNVYTVCMVLDMLKADDPDTKHLIMRYTNQVVIEMASCVLLGTMEWRTDKHLITAHLEKFHRHCTYSVTHIFAYQVVPPPI